MTKESNFERETLLKIEKMFPGCIILKNDPQLNQGIPDRLILWGYKWAVLEFKASKNSLVRPNQQVYVEIMDRMSFARFIYPENRREVLNDLQRAFGT